MLRILPTVARLMPPSWVSGLGRLQFAVPWTKPFIQSAARSLRSGPSVIRHGIGKGLKFDPCGGNPGYALGTSEPEEQALLAQTLAPGDVYYDIGANVGFFAVLGANLVGPTGRVYAFEPFPQSVAAVRRNAALNDFEQIEVIEAAVSDRGGRGSFVLNGTAVEFRLESSAIAKSDDAGERINVEVVAVDELIAAGRLRPPRFVMIDVEGSEIDVLRGMANTLRTHRPTILCEVHWLGKSFLEICEQLIVPAGYDVRRLDGAPMSDAPERYHALMLPNR